ncbi:hypothetical protein KI387_000100, partial [Taxus chinensis]
GYGDVVGKFVFVDPRIDSFDHTTFTRILVDMDMTADFLTILEMKVMDSTWTQNLDFEGLPFRYQTCFSLGHLASDCQIVKKPIKGRVSWWKDFNPDNLVVDAQEDNYGFDNDDSLL